MTFRYRRRLVLAFCAIAFVGLMAVSGMTPPTPARAAASSAVADQAPAATEILWDRFGIPHIYGASVDDAMFAYGWAQMHSHGDLLLRLYAQARGRGAEFHGEDLLAADRWVRTMGVPKLAASWATQQTPEAAAVLASFAAGVNAYAAHHPDRLSKAGQGVLPVTPVDLLAHSLRVVHFAFVANPQSLEPQMRRWAEAGSNTWAVAPKRTAAGRALLLVNPHLPWSDFFTWYEAQIVVPGLSAYGASLVGMPILGIAFNDRLGWSHTNNTIDGADLYELETVDGGYRWNGGVRSFDSRTETIRVRRADGTLGAETLTVRESVHGPVVRTVAGKALALRVAGIDQPNLVDQYLRMLRARSLAEFEAAQRPLQMPFFTVMYADADGHIMHLFGGRTPVRPVPSLNWAGIVPGSSSETLWTASHPYEQLPRVVDPASGWLQNANDPPWTTTFPAAIDATAFPRYMAPRGMSFRAQQSAALIEADPAVTFEKFVELKHSTRVLLADRLLDNLIPAARAAGGAAAEAAKVLEAWDRQTDAGSRGAVLFEAWYRAVSRTGPVFATPWSESAPRTTPDGLRDPAVAVKALVDAAAEVRKAHGAIDVAWGQVYRLRVDGRDLPANGGPGELGIFRVVGFGADADGRQVARGGDSYVAAVEFGPRVRAQALIAYGNASQPGSPHRVSQIEFFARKQLRPVWLTRAEVEQNLERREVVIRR